MIRYLFGSAIGFHPPGILTTYTIHINNNNILIILNSLLLLQLLLLQLLINNLLINLTSSIDLKQLRY